MTRPPTTPDRSASDELDVAAPTVPFATLERRLLDALAREAKVAAAAVLQAAGYRQHARGVWRLSRHRDRPMTTNPTPAVSPADPVSRSEALAQLDRLLDLARASRQRAREFLDLYLKIAGEGEAEVLARLGGDPVAAAEEVYIARLCQGDQLAREATRRGLATLRAGLLAGGDSATERIIVDRAIACHLAVQDAERNLARLLRKGESPRIPDQKRLDHAQKRLLDCLKALDQVRRKTPAAHRLNVAVLGDVRLEMPPGAPATPAPIDVTPARQLPETC